MSFGDNLRKYRKIKGLSQAALGKQMGLKASIIGRYELCKSTPKPERISQFASALDVTPSELLDFEPDFIESKGKSKMSESHQGQREADFIHERIKSERLRAGLKQQEVADKLGITRQSYARYENGTVNEIGIDFIAKVCEILNTSPDYLFWGKRTITDTLELWHLVRDVESDIEKIKVMLKGN